MSKEPKVQYGQLFLCVLMTGLLLVGIWYGFLTNTLTQLEAKKKRIAEIQETLKTAIRQETLARKLQDDLENAEQKLARMEAKMIAGDTYRWLTKTFLDSPPSHNVHIASLDPPHVGELAIWPKVPYKLATFALSGTAYYKDFGGFLAQLENDFPHMRLKRLDLEPASFADVPAEEGEKLNFKLQIVTLVNPKPPPTEGLSLAAPAPAKE